MSNNSGDCSTLSASDDSIIKSSGYGATPAPDAILFVIFDDKTVIEGELLTYKREFLGI